ncbi:putative U1 small nuclear ribonucleoprotein [Leishmania major strain Friedlin]|uniref:Putative U1 small nuclear ribonucleoprotein n=1 Tax=Leishmania major TaxID=5664 RepID=Q4QEK6_LEIMA|nr:putative U1 small nuclear ribonucleoprotein [Leishmania major strain Friedlin]CAG9572203.1 U1_small_nuclear_ribonucleoprotein_-_putative [Leishmania major strain Friedlin]CAJ04192.1 putative U1 small nuclear ribonucleoprotein [Leishmania major strain Friedlin]|eukprot:XP_001682242.1 putative U1 small nuclear ribonucleoprotein [Leishmania major strain Friedlin]
MMEGDEEESRLQRKRVAAHQRQEMHAAWKRTFFQARPPPPSIGRLHRRQPGITKGHSCHNAFNTALALAKQADEDEPTRDAKVDAPLPSSSTLTRSATATAAGTLSKQEAWAAQLQGENERRNPFTDLNARSDPLRTVVMANLHPETVEEDLRHFADQFGRVLSVRIVRHHRTGKSRRYAFVEFNLVGEARKAVQFHRKKRLKGYSIIIDREKGRTEPGFLPKRLLTASSFWTPPANEASSATSAEIEQARTVDSAALGTGGAKVVLPMPENDDDFLNAILNS